MRLHGNVQFIHPCLQKWGQCHHKLLRATYLYYFSFPDLVVLCSFLTTRYKTKMLKYKTKNTICIVAEYYWSRAQSHRSAALGLWITGQYKHSVVLGFLLLYDYGFFSVNPVFSDVGARIVLAICEISVSDLIVCNGDLDSLKCC